MRSRLIKALNNRFYDKFMQLEIGLFGKERFWGSSPVTRSDSESIFQQQLGENDGDDGCYSIYFDSDTILWHSGSL